MKIVINNEQTKNKELYYEEGFWTGKRTITYNGILLKKIKMNLYEYNDGENIEQFQIKGNQLFGVSINMFGNNVEVSRKLTWYEIVMAVLVFIPCILFGAIGGAIGGALGFTNLTIIRQVKKVYLKVIISAQFLIAGFLLSYLIGYVVLKVFIFG